MPLLARMSVRIRALISVGFVGAIITGCGGAPVVPELPRRIVAFDTEADGARRYARGDLDGAARRFAAAERAFLAIDDATGVARNRRHQARTALAQNQPAAALELLTTSAPEPDTQLLRAQAHLSIGEPSNLTNAAKLLKLSAEHCAIACAHETALHLLQARLALANADHSEAAVQAQAALAVLGKEEGAEAANAHRLLAEALLAGGLTNPAEASAMQALALDRKLAQPEKITRDWMLLGAIYSKVGAGDTATSAYRQARDVAKAAGLNHLLTAAEAALAGASQ